MNKSTIGAFALAFTTLSFAAHAEEVKKPSGQQSRMALCNKDAVGKKGDERKAFMKECLSAKKAEAQAKQ